MKDYGYVCFKNPDDAEKALDAMNKKPIKDNQFLIVNRHISKRENELSGGSKMGPITQNLTKTFNSNVYVKFIPTDITEEEVRNTFASVGNIISMRLDKCKRNIGGSEVVLYQFGYILYEKVEEAQAAIKKFDTSNVFGNKPLHVELWLSEEEIKQERKQRENREVSAFVNAIFK